MCGAMLQGPKEPPKMSLTKCELVLHLMGVYPDVIGRAPCNMAPLTTFGISGINHTAAPVRKYGEKIILKLYDLDPKTVKKTLPQDNPKNRKINFHYRTIYEEFERRENAPPPPPAPAEPKPEDPEAPEVSVTAPKDDDDDVPPDDPPDAS